MAAGLRASRWSLREVYDVDQIIGLVVGIMSMGMVVMTALFLVYDAKFSGMPSSHRCGWSAPAKGPETRCDRSVAQST